jgi:hypothetical protein
MVTHDRPVALEVIMLGLSASCVCFTRRNFVVCVPDSAVYHDSAMRCVLFVYSQTSLDWSREGDATTKAYFPTYYIVRTAAVPDTRI